LNWKIVEQFQQNLGAYIGMRCLLNSFGCEMTDDLFYSMYLSYARQLAGLGDLIYMFYKNAQNIGNFGKDDIEKKGLGKGFHSLFSFCFLGERRECRSLNEILITGNDEWNQCSSSCFLGVKSISWPVIR